MHFVKNKNIELIYSAVITIGCCSQSRSTIRRMRYELGMGGFAGEIVIVHISIGSLNVRPITRRDRLVIRALMFAAAY